LSNTSRAMSWWSDREAASRWPSTPAAGRSGKKRRLAVVASSPFSGRPLSQSAYILVRSHILSLLSPPLAPLRKRSFYPLLAQCKRLLLTQRFCLFFYFYFRYFSTENFLLF
jgi:hypothetical protein